MTYRPMKPLYILLSLGLFVSGSAEAQTSPATQSTTTPKSTTATTTNRSSVRPPATRAASSTTSSQSPATGQKPNRQQELYDQYHGITRKPTPAPPVQEAPVATEPTPQAAPEPVVAKVSKPEEPAVANPNANARIGVRGGVTYPFFLEQPAGIDPAIGFVGGIVMQIGRGTFSFQPEINYSRVAVNTTGFGSSTIRQATDQVIVPLFLKISSGTFQGNRLFVNIGPYGSYISSYSINGVNADISGSTGRFDFGAAAGVGAMLKAGPGHVTIEARGRYKFGNDADGFNTDSKTIFGEGTIGYIFPLGH